MPKPPSRTTPAEPSPAEVRARYLIQELDLGRVTPDEIPLKPGTLKWWRYEIVRRDLRRAGGLAVPEAESSALLPVHVIDCPSPALSAELAPYELVLRGGRLLRVPSNFDVGRLGALIAAVEAVPC